MSEKKTYAVTCYATRVYRVEFYVEATSTEEAIRFAQRREDADGEPIFESFDEFEETVEEVSFQASLSDYQRSGGAA